MNILILIILIILVVLNAYASVIGAPIALTSKSLINEIIKSADVKNGDNFYELGTGTGRVITAFTKMKEIKATGFELSPVFYFVTLLNLIFHNRNNYKLYLQNFFNADLKNADIIFCFLMSKTMEKLKNKFEKELKPDAKIISFAFPIKEWTPYLVIKKERQIPVYFYKIK